MMHYYAYSLIQYYALYHSQNIIGIHELLKGQLEAALNYEPASFKNMAKVFLQMASFLKVTRHIPILQPFNNDNTDITAVW